MCQEAQSKKEGQDFPVMANGRKRTCEKQVITTPGFNVSYLWKINKQLRKNTGCKYE